MTDTALQNAEAMRNQLIERRKRLQSELLHLDAEIGRADQFIKAWREFADLVVTDGDHISVIERKHDGNKGESPGRIQANRIKNSRKEDVANMALALIQERGEPIPRDELYRLLTEHGLTIQGKDPEMVLSTMLWRMKDRIVRLRTGGYWIEGKDWEPAGYIPEQIASERRAEQ